MSNRLRLAPLDLYARLQDDGARPRLAFSSADGERLELSGRVLANWSAKTANLLVGEAHAETGSTVGTDLARHWRPLVWALGTWLTGATVVLPGTADGDQAGYDAVITTDPERWLPGSDVVVAVPLPSFALRWPGTLPGAALDGSADVASHPDALGPVAGIDPDAVALQVGAATWTYATLSAGDQIDPTLAEHPLAGPLLAVVAALADSSDVVALKAARAMGPLARPNVEH